MFVKVGTYTGDGLDNKAITGIGFQPKFVIVKGNAAHRAILRGLFSGSDLSVEMADSNIAAANKIQSLDSDGFTVGTHAFVNTNAVVYWYLAVGGTTNINNLTWAGNSTDNRSITGAGFQPELAIVANLSGNNWPRFRTSDMPAETGLSSSGFNLNSQADRLQALEADGIQVSANDAVNATGTNYEAIVFNTEAGVFTVFTYTGDGVDDRTVTGFGFQPDFVLIKRHNSTNASVMRFKDQAGDSSSRVDALADAANQIQSLDADGVTLGTSSLVNLAATTYHGFAFKEAIETL